MTAPSDRDLIERVRHGGDSADGRAAFGQLVRLHQKRIYRLALHMLRSRSEAEDATQETFVRAYRALGQFKGDSELYTWLHRIAIHVCLNRIRADRALSRPVLFDKDADDGRLDAFRGEAESVETQASRREVYRALAEGVDALSESLRTTLILVCVEGFSHEEAAEMLGAPTGTIAWRVHEARRKLSEYMSARGFATTEGDS